MLVGLFGLFLCGLLLELSVDAGWVMELVVPRPSDTFLAFPEVQNDMDLIGNFFVTLRRKSILDHVDASGNGVVELAKKRRGFVDVKTRQDQIGRAHV